MKNSKASLAIALLMLFILACTCGKKYENSNNRNISIDVNNSNNSNTSNDNRTENSNRNGNANTPTVSSSSTGIAECDAYIKMIEDYISCESIPAANREQWRKQRDDTVQQIRDSAKTDAQKAVMAGVCKQMVDTVKDTLVCK